MALERVVWGSCTWNILNRLDRLWARAVVLGCLHPLELVEAAERADWVWDRFSGEFVGAQQIHELTVTHRPA